MQSENNFDELEPNLNLALDKNYIQIESKVNKSNFKKQSSNIQNEIQQISIQSLINVKEIKNDQIVQGEFTDE